MRVLGSRASSQPLRWWVINATFDPAHRALASSPVDWLAFRLQRYRAFLDFVIPNVTSRWVALLVMFIFYAARTYYLQVCCVLHVLLHGATSAMWSHDVDGRCRAELVESWIGHGVGHKPGDVAWVDS